MNDIYYKVVAYDDYSCMVTHPVLELKYTEGEVITAPEGTIGILAFKTEGMAMKFKEDYWPFHVGYKIRLVQSIGKVSRPTYKHGMAVHRVNTPVIGNSFTEIEITTLRDMLSYLREWSPSHSFTCWPEGTICLESCRVMEETIWSKKNQGK